MDGAIDGLTLGIAVSIGLKEAALIAVAMTVEMCFVGVTLSGKLQESNRSAGLKYLIVIVVPLFMYLGFVTGAYALYGLDETDAVYVAVIGFSAAALLYLALVRESDCECSLANRMPNGRERARACVIECQEAPPIC